MRKTDGSLGLAVIFAFGKFNDRGPYTQRDGVENEILNLTNFFQLLHLRVSVLRDLYLEDMKHALRVVSNPESWQETYVKEEIWNARILPHDSICCIAITSHGIGSQILCSDGYRIEESYIEALFNEDYCSILRGKPKMFIYNKCRNYSECLCETLYPNPCAGDQMHNLSSQIEISSKDEAQQPPSTSTNQHMISFYTCASGTVSFGMKGSIVLSKLPETYDKWRKHEIENNRCQGHIVDFLTEFMCEIVPLVNERMKKGDQRAIVKREDQEVTQCPSIERLRLTNYLYFFACQDDVDCPNSNTLESPLIQIADNPSSNQRKPNKISSSDRLSSQERDMQENKSKSPRKS